MRIDGPLASALYPRRETRGQPTHSTPPPPRDAFNLDGPLLSALESLKRHARSPPRVSFYPAISWKISPGDRDESLAEITRTSKIRDDEVATGTRFYVSLFFPPPRETLRGNTQELRYYQALPLSYTDVARSPLARSERRDAVAFRVDANSRWQGTVRRFLSQSRWTSGGGKQPVHPAKRGGEEDEGKRQRERERMRSNRGARVTRRSGATLRGVICERVKRYAAIPVIP